MMSTTYDATNYLKYINLQMAAEAFLDQPNVNNSNALKTFLINGNNRNSKFTDADAQKFIDDGWIVLNQKSNTTTGFSGTLFRNNEGEYAFALRGTELGVADLMTDLGDILPDGIALGQIAGLEMAAC